MDFTKFKMTKESTYVTYQCEKCGESDEYVIELPEHMRSHNPDSRMRNCGGQLIETSRRTVPR